MFVYCSGQDDQPRKQNMTKEIIEKIGCSRRHWNYMLNCEKNASKRLALVIENELGISKEVFVFGSKADRRSAVKKYIRRMAK